MNNTITTSELVAREVIHNASTLVYELSKNPSAHPDYEDDLYSAWDSGPDFEECLYQNDWDQLNDGAWAQEGIVAEYDCDAEELCAVMEYDAEDYRREVFEHWIVSEWLADKLEEKGELVLRDFFGMTVWGRTTTGQSIAYDCVIKEIHAELVKNNP